jgi:hypothetical protein
MLKFHSYVRQNDSECRKWKVYRGFTLHGFSYVWLLTFILSFKLILKASLIRPVLLVEESGEAGENQQPVCKGYSLSHNVVSSTPCLSRVRTRVGKKPVNTGASLKQYNVEISFICETK